MYQERIRSCVADNAFLTSMVAASGFGSDSAGAGSSAREVSTWSPQINPINIMARHRTFSVPSLGPETKTKITRHCGDDDEIHDDEDVARAGIARQSRRPLSRLFDYFFQI